MNLNLHRQRMGMVFQHFNLFPHKTVLQNITMAPVRLKLMNREAAKEKAMELFKQNRSGGESGRISRHALRRPETANCYHPGAGDEPRGHVFDEPTSALDPEMVGEVLDLMKDLAKEG